MHLWIGHKPKHTSILTLVRKREYLGHNRSYHLPVALRDQRLRGRREEDALQWGESTPGQRSYGSLLTITHVVDTDRLCASRLLIHSETLSLLEALRNEAVCICI